MSFRFYLAGSIVLFAVAYVNRDLPLAIASALFIFGGIAGLCGR